MIFNNYFELTFVHALLQEMLTENSRSAWPLRWAVPGPKWQFQSRSEVRKLTTIQFDARISIKLAKLWILRCLEQYLQFAYKNIFFGKSIMNSTKYIALTSVINKEMLIKLSRGRKATSKIFLSNLSFFLIYQTV